MNFPWGTKGVVFPLVFPTVIHLEHPGAKVMTVVHLEHPGSKVMTVAHLEQPGPNVMIWSTQAPK